MAFTGSDLRALRVHHERSVSSIARMVGVHRNTWARMEDDAEVEVPLTVRLALAAWVRGVPAIGDDRK